MANVKKRNVSISNDELWYEDLDVASGEMTELVAANGGIDTSEPLSMFEMYGKVFICNGTNKKVADFTNIKLTTDDLGANPPDFQTVLIGGTSEAAMVVDYITSLDDDAACILYGRRTTVATFVDTETVEGKDNDGNDISFVLTANEVMPPHWYDWTPFGNDDTYGEMPDQVYLGCNWGGSAMISGDRDYPHQWYKARQGNPWDWNYVSNDAASPIAGGNSKQAGQIGDVVKAVIPYDKDYFIFGCANSLYYCVGNPSQGGSILVLDATSGILSKDSWCFDRQGDLYILTTSGLLKIPRGFGGIVNLTEETYPDFIKDLAYNYDSHTLCMGFDRKQNGIKIAKTTTASGVNACWWFDIQVNGLFYDVYPEEAAPHCFFDYESHDPDFSGLLSGCHDGYIRIDDDDATDDDIGGETDELIDSYVTFGPLPLSEGNSEGKIGSIVGVTTGGLSGGTRADSNNVTFKVWTGASADEVVEKLKANSTPEIGGIISAPGRGRGGYNRKSVRGMYGGIRVGNDTLSQTWGLEKLIIEGKKTGRAK